jgi:transcriptional regulator with XRE-family HTH domain
LLSESSVLGTLAARLKYHRAEKGWSQEQLASKASIHRTYLAEIERSRRNPSLRNLIKLANGLAVPLTVLFEPLPSLSEGSKRRK